MDSHLAITVNTPRGTLTEHWTTSRVEARTIVAHYIATHGLRRNAYSDNEPLFDGEVRVGHYTLTDGV